MGYVDLPQSKNTEEEKAAGGDEEDSDDIPHALFADNDNLYEVDLDEINANLI